MSRRLVALLFIMYFVVLAVYGALVTPVGVLRHEGAAGLIGSAIGYGIVFYFASGVLPFEPSPLFAQATSPPSLTQNVAE